MSLSSMPVYLHMQSIQEWSLYVLTGTWLHQCVYVAAQPRRGTDNLSESPFSVINYTAALLIPYSKHNTNSVYLSLSLFPYASPTISLSPSSLFCLSICLFFCIYTSLLLLLHSFFSSSLFHLLFLSASCFPSSLLHTVLHSLLSCFFSSSSKYTDDSL